MITLIFWKRKNMEKQEYITFIHIPSPCYKSDTKMFEFFINIYNDKFVEESY